MTRIEQTKLTFICVLGKGTPTESMGITGYMLALAITHSVIPKPMQKIFQ